MKETDLVFKILNTARPKTDLRLKLAAGKVSKIYVTYMSVRSCRPLSMAAVFLSEADKPEGGYDLDGNRTMRAEA